jgi:hypothetical protein
VAIGVVDAHPDVGPASGRRHAVVFGEDGVDERVLPVEQLEHRAVVANRVVEEADRLLEHRLPQVVGELGEPRAIDRVEVCELAEVEPVSAELDGQSSCPLVVEHAPRLSGERHGVAQLACCSEVEQRLVGHARPKKIAEPAGQGVVG